MGLEEDMHLSWKVCSMLTPCMSNKGIDSQKPGYKVSKFMRECLSA